ncbi:dual specificity protein phosphatase 12 [Anaeramoeba ignava]|uniref:protein-tyrosine-phosphatase n=1 Tax=Anaeramoeba ignava TaxID=1746090 RepID=A0A9Q0RH36_ANAIG|nr:dual specificity protein phosphatase 12 [Anaeramoeba ignava]
MQSIDISVIQKHLFLGSEKSIQNIQKLKELEIKRVLSVEKYHEKLEEFKNHQDILHMIIEINDMETENLLSHIESALNFIENGLKKNENVLVHCQAGTSRSPAIVVGYFMKTYNLEFKDANEIVASVRPSVQINQGFISQLELFYKMGFNFNGNSIWHKEYRMKNYLNLHKEKESINTNQLENDEKQKSQEINEKSIEKTEIQIDPKEYVHFRCKLCRQILFTEDNLVEHETGYNAKNFNEKKKSETKMFCSSYFIEPMDWIKNTSQINGKISCLKCGTKIGSFNWSGSQCSCGVWVSPSFRIPKTKVDRIDPKNQLIK